MGLVNSCHPGRPFSGSVSESVSGSEVRSLNISHFTSLCRSFRAFIPAGATLPGVPPNLRFGITSRLFNGRLSAFTVVAPAGGVFCNTGYCKCGSEDLRSRRFYPPSPINSGSVSESVSGSEVRSLNISHFTSLVPPFNSTCQASPLYEIQPGRCPG